MNWRRGITRLLAILLPVAGFAVLLTRILGTTLRSIGYFVAFWLGLLLLGLVVSYCIFYLVRLVGRVFGEDLNKEEHQGEGKSISLDKQFKELTWVTAVITSAIAFFVVPLTSAGRETMPDNPINFVLSFSVFLVTFCLVWAVYTIIRFIVAGFVNGDKRS